MIRLLTLFGFGAFALVMFLLSCILSCQPAQPYRYIQGPTGQNMVVVHDNGNEVLMDALIFQSLMSQGGYNNVITHYHMSPNSYQRYDRRAYSNWHTVSRPSYTTQNSYQRTGNPSPVQFRNTTPTPPLVRSSYQRSSTPSYSPRPTFRSTTPSYSSPSRSSYSRSSSRH